jgi:HlyD family secretion protein
VITVPASGSIVGRRVADLDFTIPGVVKEVYVDVGDQVEKGQVLAELDDRDLQLAVDFAEIALEQAKLNLQSLFEPAKEPDIELADISITSAQQQLAVANLNKKIAAAQAELSNRLAREVRDDVLEAYQNFQETLDRYNLPYAYGAGITAAKMEAEGNVGITALKGNLSIEQADSSWWIANNALEQAQQAKVDLSSEADTKDVEQAQLQVDQAEINVEQAKQRLANAVITAPFDGTISAVNISENLLTPVGRVSALTLLDDKTLFAEVSIDEIDIGQVSIGQQSEINLDAYPDTTLQGTVNEIEDIPTDLGGIVAYQVRISLDDLESTRPRDGMTVSVFITTRIVEDVLLIPNWAVRTDQTTTETYVYCYCLVNGIPQRTSVVTGARNDVYTEVLSGLDEGATVVLVSEERSLFEFSGPPSLGE